MKHLYFIAIAILLHSLFFRMTVNGDPSYRELSLDDAIGFTSVIWIIMITPIFMLMYDPQQRKE